MDQRLRTIIDILGRAYRRRLYEGARVYKGIAESRAFPGLVGRYAEKAFLEKDLREHTGRKRPDAADPLTAVSGLGGPRKLDAAHVVLAGIPVDIELKKSTYRDYRVEHQEASQLLDLALGTRGSEHLVRFYGENGYAEAWTRRAAEEALKAGGKTFRVPPPSDIIRFGKDTTTAKTASHHAN